MKNKLFLILATVIFITIAFAKNINNPNNGPVSIQVGNDNPVFVRVQNLSVDQSREEIDLIVDDFEGDVSGWNVSDGWQLTDFSSSSPDHSFLSPDELFYDDSFVKQN